MPGHISTQQCTKYMQTGSKLALLWLLSSERGPKTSLEHHRLKADDLHCVFPRLLHNISYT